MPVSGNSAHGASLSEPDPGPLSLSVPNLNHHFPADIYSSSAPSTPFQPPARSTQKPAEHSNIGTYLKTAAKWAYLPISHERRKLKTQEQNHYCIEYSVFKPLRNHPTIANEQDLLAHWKAVLASDDTKSLALAAYPDNYITPEVFNDILEGIISTMETDELQPERISQGSSGSYFVYNRKVVEFGIEKIYRAGVFKPKDEEPYGPLSPKWTKWLHRTFFPCFFGRSCLIPNLGYISETGASVLDAQLLSFIVPHTDVVYLKSSSFYYSYWDRHLKTLPAKVGSLQLFLDGYVDAQTWFKMFPLPVDITLLPETYDIRSNIDDDIDESQFVFKWSKNNLQQFQEQLEQLVILDYIMRNTDRGLDNWMIKVDWKQKIVVLKNGNRYKKHTPVMKIGAIDSGLAFPWKHPDEWRSFPFGWLFLPYSIIGQSFSRKTRNHYIPLLTSKYWWEQTVTKLKSVFQKDSDFKERMWLKQLAVLKGQAFNVVEILKLPYAGPLELTRRENLLIWDDDMNVPVLVDNENVANAMESSIYDLAHSDPTPESRHNINTIMESDGLENETEQTPLLLSSALYKSSPVPIQNGSESEYSSISEPAALSMSGFEYNDGKNKNKPQPTATKKVVIERLQKVESKPPVFTWC